MTVRSDSPRRAWGAPLLWCALLLGLVAFKMSPQWHPVQSNDSYQYLSIALNFARGYIGQTSLIYFDEERRHGTIPAPMTTFPVGYPAMIAALDALVHLVELAALLVSLAYGLGTVIVMDRLGRELVLSPAMRNLALAGIVASALTIQFSSAVLSESSFTFVALPAQLLFLRAIGAAAEPGRQLRLAIGAGPSTGAPPRGIDALAGKDGVVMSNDGQASGHVLQRPTVSLVSGKYNSLEWTEQYLHATVDRFGVKALIIHKDRNDTTAGPYPSAFIAQLAAGRPPGWLRRIAESPSLVLYAPTSP